MVGTKSYIKLKNDANGSLNYNFGYILLHLLLNLTVIARLAVNSQASMVVGICILWVHLLDD